MRHGTQIVEFAAVVTKFVTMWRLSGGVATAVKLTTDRGFPQLTKVRLNAAGASTFVTGHSHVTTIS